MIDLLDTYIKFQRLPKFNKVWVKFVKAVSSLEELFCLTGRNVQHIKKVKFGFLCSVILISTAYR